MKKVNEMANYVRALTIEETLNKGYKVFTRCPMCNAEIEVERVYNEQYSYTGECKNCEMIFGYDLSKYEDKIAKTLL